MANSYLEQGDREADLILRRGQIDAQGKRNRGVILGNTLSALASLPFDLDQRKAAQAKADQEAADAALKREVTRGQLDEQKAKAANEQRFRDAMQLPTPIERVHKVAEFDPERAQKLEDAYRSQAQSLILASTPQNYAALKPTLEGIVGPGVLPEGFTTPEEHAAWKANALMDAKQYVESQKAKTPKVVPVQTVGADGQPVTKFVEEQAGAEYPRVSPATGAGSDYHQFLERYAKARHKTIDQLTDVEELDARKRFGQADDKAAGAQAADITTLTPSGLDMAALNYRKTGVMPPLGMGDRTTRQRIINRAAELTAADIQRIEAGGADLAGNRADYKADSTSLTNLQKQRDAIGAFEQTAQKNIDQFLDVAKKVPDTGIPLLNTPVRWIAGAGGNADVAKYQAARQVAISEIARIVQNPNLSGTLSDSARHEIDAFNPQSATLAQTVAVMELLKRDMANRKTALDAQLKDTRSRIGGAAPPPPTPSVSGLSYQDYLKSKGGR